MVNDSLHLAQFSKPIFVQVLIFDEFELEKTVVQICSAIT